MGRLIDRDQSGSMERKKREGYFLMAPAEESRDLLRFLTCGSIDDGKSTLIERLLRDSERLFEDELDDVAALSRIWGTRGEDIDLALLVDGPQAEREQGITIDVAYRYFSTARRRFIVADTPGHEQYIHTMATGASTADLAVILVDARKGVLAQTRRHSFVASLLGIPHAVLAVNKMDLVDWDQRVFDAIVSRFRDHAEKLDFARVDAIPVSAITGANIFEAGRHMQWYKGPTLTAILDSADAGRNAAARSFPHAGPESEPPGPGLQGLLRPRRLRSGAAGNEDRGCAFRTDLDRRAHRHLRRRPRRGVGRPVGHTCSRR